MRVARVGQNPPRPQPDRHEGDSSDRAEVEDNFNEVYDPKWDYIEKIGPANHVDL